MCNEIDALSEEQMNALEPVTEAEKRSVVSCVRDNYIAHVFRTERPLSYPCHDGFVSVPAGDWLFSTWYGCTHMSDEQFRRANERVVSDARVFDKVIEPSCGPEHPMSLLQKDYDRLYAAATTLAYAVPDFSGEDGEAETRCAKALFELGAVIGESIKHRVESREVVFWDKRRHWSKTGGNIETPTSETGF